jgi:hypothetical protein
MNRKVNREGSYSVCLAFQAPSPRGRERDSSLAIYMYMYQFSYYTCSWPELKRRGSNVYTEDCDIFPYKVDVVRQ